MRLNLAGSTSGDGGRVGGGYGTYLLVGWFHISRYGIYCSVAVVFFAFHIRRCGTRGRRRMCNKRVGDVEWCVYIPIGDDGNEWSSKCFVYVL